VRDLRVSNVVSVPVVVPGWYSLGIVKVNGPPFVVVSTRLLLLWCLIKSGIRLTIFVDRAEPGWSASSPTTFLDVMATIPWWLLMLLMVEPGSTAITELAERPLT